MHFYAWKKGLKTGMYYLRTKAATDAIKFTVTKDEKKTEVPQEAVAQTSGTAAMTAAEKDSNQQAMQCSLDDPEGCEMCGS